jgi:hypothetical protein
MDTAGIEVELMAVAEVGSIDKHHSLGNWETYLGGIVRLSCCIVCNRHVWAQVLPNGSDDKGTQVYETDIHGPALLVECSKRKVN